MAVIQLFANKRVAFLRIFFPSEEICSICVIPPYQMHKGLLEEVTTVWNVPVSSCLIRTGSLERLGGCIQPSRVMG